MVVDPPQHKSTIQAEAIASMERCSHRQRFAQGDDKGDTTQKNVQISGIRNAQPRIFIDPGPLKGINREPASVRLERIKQRGDPNMRVGAEADPSDNPIPQARRR